MILGIRVLLPTLSLITVNRVTPVSCRSIQTLKDSRCNSLTAEGEVLEAITGHSTTPPVRASTTQLVCTGPEKTCSRQPSMYPPLTNFNRIPPFQLLNRSPPSKGLLPGQPLSRYGGHP
ncbi:hypothetical protein AVEN_114521-1 [Araneus ventricosus]|uniref:Secreted protein n=1 Tax=Araneus ventricosus TaxID=182803 RepID=A0A4Y2SRM5_ARAVE|nr:hypothetical protein AVEN_253042-1 [Araneus ventricosus]GBN90076.1 hypothetical protein AVEN_114521-1 [Araneus ventricosus]